MSMLVKNGTVVTHEGRRRANLLLRGGLIEAITAGEPEADEVIDAEGLYVLPGIIDPHVHFRQPGMEAEDWHSGPMAAVAGGITTVLDMPNTRPPCTTLELLESKRRMVAESRPCVNYGFHFGATSSNIHEMLSVGALIEGKVSRTVASVKVFMGSSTGELLVTEPGALRRIMQYCRLATVHAEDEQLLKEYANAPDHASRRPKKTALSAIRKLLACSPVGRVYVCHVTSYDEAELAAPFYREATPHHLLLTSEMMSKIGNYAKVNPPLRDEADRLSLWRALSEGKIDAIGSDHAPHSAMTKESTQPPSGMPGVETSLPLMLDASLREMLSLEKVVELMSFNPARIFGLRGKGEVKQGMDADLTVVDLHTQRKVAAESLHYKCGWTPFEGLELKGWPVFTIVRGQAAYWRGEFRHAEGREVVHEG